MDTNYALGYSDYNRNNSEGAIILPIVKGRGPSVDRIADSLRYWSSKDDTICASFTVKFGGGFDEVAHEQELRIKVTGVVYDTESDGKLTVWGVIEPPRKEKDPAFFVGNRVQIVGYDSKIRTGTVCVFEKSKKVSPKY